MRKHLRRLAPIGVLAVTGALAAAMLIDTGPGAAATKAEADEPDATDDQRDSAGRLDAHRPRRPVDGQSDGLRVRLAAL